MPEFARGQYVELYPTIPSSRGGSIPSGTRAVVVDVDPARGDACYLVEFLANEAGTGAQTWLTSSDLFAA